MDALEQELYDLVSDSLYEMTWRCDFPVQPNIGLWCFLEAFRAHDAHVEMEGNNAVFMLAKEVAGKTYLCQSAMSTDEILRGWGWHPRGSPHAFYDSICEVYDRMGRDFSGWQERNDWHSIRGTDSKKVRQKMEDRLQEFFPKYQEHVLLPVSGTMPKLEEPRLFYRVLENYPIDVLRAARISEPSLGPCPETLLDIDWDFDPNEYHPSASAMADYFWGHYLHALAKEKGYQVNYPEEALRELVGRGWDAFKRGSLLWPTRERKNLSSPC